LYRADKDLAIRNAHHNTIGATNKGFSNGGRMQENTKVDSCLARYPELLARVDIELAPWAARGITRAMVDSLWRCGPSHEPDARRVFGAIISIRSGSVATERAGVSNLRAQILADMVRSIAEEFPLPDCDFTMSTADHPSHAFYRPYNGSFHPQLAPLLVPYRLQRDDGTVAAPGRPRLMLFCLFVPLPQRYCVIVLTLHLCASADWTFFSNMFHPAHLPDIDGAASIIHEAAAKYPWDQRTPQVTVFWSKLRAQW
jgi:hypothetical protein